MLIEGGGQILSQALDARLIDRVQIYLAPILTGGPALAFAGKGAGSSKEALRLANVRYEPVDGDICISGYPLKERNDEGE